MITRFQQLIKDKQQKHKITSYTTIKYSHFWMHKMYETSTQSLNPLSKQPANLT